MIQWLFRNKPEDPSVSKQLELFEDRIAALERGQKRVVQALEDLEDGVTRRFGKLFARLKRPENDESKEPEGELPPRPPNGLKSDSVLLQEMRRRRGLLHG